MVSNFLGGVEVLGPLDPFLRRCIVRSGETECPDWYQGSVQKGGGLSLGVEEAATPVAALVLGDSMQAEAGSWTIRETK